VIRVSCLPLFKAELGGQDRGVLSIIGHPKTDSATLDFDFAILVLSSPVNTNNGTIGAVCLPKERNIFKILKFCFLNSSILAN
jgi:hypothetical protein